MKVLLILFISLTFSAPSFAQRPYNKNLKVNDTEFIISGILLSGGVISIGTGLLSKTGNAIFQGIVRDNSENTAGDTFLIAGGISMIAGALLYFDAKTKQKKRFAANLTSANIPKLKYGKMCQSNITSLSITFQLSK